MRWRIAALVAIIALAAPGGARASAVTRSLTDYVDPFIGTLGAGFVFPGPAAPYGMVQLSPDTNGVFAYTGYQYIDPKIRGFSHVHTESMGVYEGGEIPFMPEVGAVSSNVYSYEQPFSHATEQAAPGYYSVVLGNGVRAELTASTRVGVHRYTFPPAIPASIVIEPGRSVGDGDPRPDGDQPPQYRPATVSVRADGVVLGTAAGGDYPVHFAARLDRPVLAVASWDSPAGTPHAGVTDANGTGAGVALSFEPGSTVVAEVGISFVSEANALENLDAEMAGRAFDFDDVRARTTGAWDAALHAITVDGGTPDQVRAFYTALYHAQLHPNVFNDVNGEYIGYDGNTHSIADAPMNGHPYYANFSLWDTYRAEMPLLMLIAPDRVSDMMRSFAAIVQQGGRLPRWGWMNRYADFMNGEPALQVYADAYCRGLVPDDVDVAIYANAVSLALDQAHHRDPEFLSRGYTSGEASKTLEHSMGDFALALVANARGDAARAADLAARARNWQNLFDDADTKLIRPRNADGSWFGNEYLPGPAGDRYLPEAPDRWREGTGWQYTWLVPHDPAGLFARMGYDEATQRLDGFFAGAAAPVAGPEAQQKLTAYGIAYYGNQYAPSNEHDLQAPWLYDWLGAPWKGQALQRSLQTLYRATPDGLPGNDDLGTMSAWFIWSALGFYPVTPGSPTYAVGSPLFPRAYVRLPDGTATVEAPATSLAMKYVNGLTLDGVANDASPSFAHDVFHPGAVIRFEMSAVPSPTWAATPPPSQTSDSLEDFRCGG